ncbi:chromate transporter [Mesomycoplasma lagogenitalium]|uniref:Chromate transporter n=1 Tax=Mesomycoplasma lagogenitalium TaxID=171286 RepID=A0ABY8LX16_9BACT|nr:chromate transporter [Mesomycoplasma lagogenitalium]WGI36806.1 chromate transporter [Mesomycoplasma lagogenitalium]
MFILLMLAVFLGIIIIALIVFGGGQVFMPIFQWFWTFLSQQFDLGITQDKIDTVFTISNSTPGVVSTKFAAFTGILVANGAWWGWIVSFFTYLIFCLPVILLMTFSMKVVKKTKENKYLVNMMKFINPILAGVLISLAIQLFISIIAPNVYFNENFNQPYAWIEENSKSNFFSGWRLIVLVIWVPLFVGFSIFYYFKKKPLYYLFIGGIISSLILFQPWL